MLSLLILLLSSSLRSGKLLSSSTPPPCPLSVTLSTRSTISLALILKGVSCPAALDTLPSTVDITSNSNNGNSTETFPSFIDILYTLSVLGKVLENINHYEGYLWSSVFYY